MSWADAGAYATQVPAWLTEWQTLVCVETLHSWSVRLAVGHQEMEPACRVFYLQTHPSDQLTLQLCTLCVLRPINEVAHVMHVWSLRRQK